MTRSYVSKVAKTLQERGTDYAPPSINHQLTADLLSKWLTHRLGLDVRLTAEDVCAMNVLQKLSRLAHVSKDDSWLDVVGYAENVAMLDPNQRNTVPCVRSYGVVSIDPSPVLPSATD